MNVLQRIFIIFVSKMLSKPCVLGYHIADEPS